MTYYEIVSCVYYAVAVLFTITSIFHWDRRTKDVAMLASIGLLCLGTQFLILHEITTITPAAVKGTEHDAE
jgi:sugar phosphate permease